MTKVETAEQQECSLERVDPAHVRLRVVVPVSEVDSAIQKAFARIARTARVPGFRPGRIPKLILEKQFWPVVRAEVEKELLANSFEKAIQARSLPITGSFHLEQVSLKRGEPLSYSAIVEVWPEIERVNYQGLQVEVPRVGVTEEQVQAVLADLQERHTKLVPIADRNMVQLGDVVELTLQRVQGRGPNEGDRRELVWLKDLESGSPFSLLIGKKVGEVVEIPWTEEDEGPPLISESPRTVWRVRIDKVFARDVPLLDNDFARTVSSTAETVDDLKAQIRQELEARAERRKAGLLRSRLRKALVDANPGVVVPPSVLRRERAELARSYVNSLGLPVDRAEEILERTPSIAQQLDNEAYVWVASEALLAKVAEEQGIRVSDNEIDDMLSRAMQERGEEAAQIRSRYAGTEGRARLKQEMVLQRALELVRQSAQVRDVLEDSQIAEAVRNS